MDKLKEKINTLRDERDAAISSSEEVKNENKKVQDELTAKERENHSLTKKVSQLESDLDEALKNLKEITEKLREIDVKSESQERETTYHNYHEHLCLTNK
ncbi:8257_t:CDS:2 [Entrophospora sp. SA101]|nr:8257_t:CDS:2 [Entrophospora sp. SA101]